MGNVSEVITKKNFQMLPFRAYSSVFMLTKNNLISDILIRWEPVGIKPSCHVDSRFNLIITVQPELYNKRALCGKVF